MPRRIVVSNGYRFAVSVIFVLGHVAISLFLAGGKRLCYNEKTEGVSVMINYAHRGASEYAPENTLSSFFLGLLQGANGIETDVQRTKDGVLVLFHDDTLDRVSDGCGPLRDHTLAQLQQLRITGNAPGGFYDRVVTRTGKGCCTQER